MKFLKTYSSSLRVSAFVSILLSSCVLYACSAPDMQVGESSLRQETIQQPIIHGKDSDSSQDSVVFLSHTSGMECTGTLITPQLVLTAMHCVVSLTRWDVKCSPQGNSYIGPTVGEDFEPSDISVITGSKLTRPLHRVAKGAKIIHPDKRNLCNADIALLVLDKPVLDVNVSSVRLREPPHEGDTITAVGWGITEGNTVLPTRQQREGIQIQHLGPYTTKRLADGSELGLGTHEFMAGEVLCVGDSGGPAFDSNSKAVIGVAARVGKVNPVTSNEPSAYCLGSDVESYYTSAQGYSGMIESAASDLKQALWKEGEENPYRVGLGLEFGKLCTADPDCTSGLCLTHPGNVSICSQECSASKACPDLYACVEQTDRNWACVSILELNPDGTQKRNTGGSSSSVGSDSGPENSTPSSSDPSSCSIQRSSAGNHAAIFLSLSFLCSSILRRCREQ